MCSVGRALETGLRNTGGKINCCEQQKGVALFPSGIDWIK